MNKKKLLALLVSSAFLFAACGDDDSPSSPKNNQEEVSSSSEEDDCDSDECDEKSSSSKSNDKKSSDSKDNDKSSSSKKGDDKSSDSKDEKSSSSTAKDEQKSSSSTAKDGKSSSSAKEEPKSSSSSVDVPEGTRAAKLTELEKNYELKIFDQTVYLSTGSKQGLIALRIPPDELWVVTYTDFANGVVAFNNGNTGKLYANTDGAKKIIEEVKKGFWLSFVVDGEGKVSYSLNDSEEYKEAVKASVAVQKGKVSKAENIKDKIYKCTDGDTTRTFMFFDNSYIVDVSAGEKLAYWTAGHYDIQRSSLLMRPEYSSLSQHSSIDIYSVGSEDNSISSSDGETTKTMSCNVEASEYEYEKASDFVGEWQATKDGLEWEFSLKEDGTFEIAAFEGVKNVEVKAGFWDVYGYHMILRNNGCLHLDKCTSIHGQLQTGPIDKATNKISGFSFIHNGTDTPKIPTSFDAPQYE